MGLRLNCEPVRPWIPAKELRHGQLGEVVGVDYLSEDRLGGVVWRSHSKLYDLRTGDMVPWCNLRDGDRVRVLSNGETLVVEGNE